MSRIFLSGGPGRTPCANKKLRNDSLRSRFKEIHAKKMIEIAHSGAYEPTSFESPWGTFDEKPAVVPHASRFSRYRKTERGVIAPKGEGRESSDGLERTSPCREVARSYHSERFSDYEHKDPGGI